MRPVICAAVLPLLFAARQPAVVPNELPVSATTQLAKSLTSGEVFDQIAYIKHLVDELAGLKPDNSNARALADRIRESLDRLEQQLGE